MNKTSWPLMSVLVGIIIGCISYFLFDIPIKYSILILVLSALLVLWHNPKYVFSRAGLTTLGIFLVLNKFFFEIEGANESLGYFKFGVSNPSRLVNFALILLIIILFVCQLLQNKVEQITSFGKWLNFKSQIHITGNWFNLSISNSFNSIDKPTIKESTPKPSQTINSQIKGDNNKIYQILVGDSEFASVLPVENQVNTTDISIRNNTNQNLEKEIENLNNYKKEKIDLKSQIKKLTLDLKTVKSKIETQENLVNEMKNLNS